MAEWSTKTTAIAAILVALAICMGCTSSAPQTEEHQSNVTSNASAQENLPQEFRLNETVNVDNVTLVADSWGYTNSWRLLRPDKGAKFMWIHFSSENIGNVPRSMPYSFSVEYRGVSGERRDTGLGDLDFLYDVYRAQMWDKIYRGDGFSGYLIFEVSDDLGANEARFFVDYAGRRFAMNLTEPAETVGSPLTISDERLVCDPPATVLLPYRHCHIAFSLANNMLIPFLSQGETGGVRLDYTINGKYSNQRIPQVSDEFLNLGNGQIVPYGNSSGSTATIISFNDNSNTYYMYYSDPALVGKNGVSIPLGKEGDSVTADVRIFGDRNKTLAEEDGVPIALTLANS